MIHQIQPTEVQKINLFINSVPGSKKIYRDQMLGGDNFNSPDFDPLGYCRISRGLDGWTGVCRLQAGCFFYCWMSYRYPD